MFKIRLNRLFHSLENDESSSKISKLSNHEAFDFLEKETSENRDDLIEFAKVRKSDDLTYWGYFEDKELAGIVSSHSIKLEGNQFVPEEFVKSHTRYSVIVLHSLHVKPDYRRQGIGDELIDFFVDYFKGKLILLYADVDNEKAIRLYLKHGFKEAWTDETRTKKIFSKT